MESSVCGAIVWGWTGAWAEVKGPSSSPLLYCPLPRPRVLLLACNPIMLTLTLCPNPVRRKTLAKGQGLLTAFEKLPPPLTFRSDRHSDQIHTAPHVPGWS